MMAHHMMAQVSTATAGKVVATGKVLWAQDLLEHLDRMVKQDWLLNEADEIADQPN